MSAPSVEWVEVGPRDGLQSWASPLPTPAKVGLITSLLDCGLRRVEATSMVHPKWVPQLADAEAVLEALQDRIDRLRVLVPNRRGLDRAKDAGVRNIAVTVAATDGYNRHNLNRSVEETLKEIAEIGSQASRDGIAVDASVGNLCSEDALTMLEAMGIKTGVDINRLIDVARGLERTLGSRLPGKVHALQPSEAKSVLA